MAKTNNEDKTTTVFISYSWDNEKHKEWVLNLANKLTTEGGVYVVFDRFDLNAGKVMTHFMEKAVNQADKVLLIMTPNYKEKADNRIGGVGYEYSMVTQELYENQDNEKFIPIRRNGKYDECAPKFLKQFISHDMTNDTTFDTDFNYLLRIIYDEPEIKRPPLGKKPTFATKSTKIASSSLIDETLDLALCGMTTFAKWTINIRLNSLADQNKSNLFKLISSNILIDKEQKHSLPFILGNSFKVSHHPEIIYEMPLQRYIEYNHLVHEKLKIDNDLIHYEFCEYGNQDFWLLHTSQPFSSLFYLLIILNSIHKQLSKNVEISITVKFNSDRRSVLYGKFSPFQYPYIFNMKNMEIPNHKADISADLSVITKDSLFNLFEKIYGLFVAENPKSQHPFVTLDRQHFDMITNEFIQ